MLADFTREHAIRYVVNAEFNEAALYFKDSSFLKKVLYNTKYML